MRSRIFSVLSAFLLPLLFLSSCDSDKGGDPFGWFVAADTVYLNGYVYTADSKDSVREALAVRGGNIVYVGTKKQAKRYIGAGTKVVDLGGRMVMPGLIDGHMHPLTGGESLKGCNLNYAAFTVDQTLAAVQSCLDAEPNAAPGELLIVKNWFRQKLLPAGTDMDRGDLDRLKTNRPIQLINFDYHSSLVNSQALARAGITRDTPDPQDGKIVRNAAGQPTGILEDGARALLQPLMPKLSPEKKAEQNLAFMGAALDVMRQQGVTSFFDAAASEDPMAALKALQQKGELTARATMAPRLPTSEDLPVEALVQSVTSLAARFDQGPLQPEPGIAVRSAKIMMDGVIQAPAQTGYVLKPYLVNKGTAEQPNWQPGRQRGSLYVAPDFLGSLLVGLAQAGIDPHMHADGDGAVRVALDAVERMRAELPDKDVRPALAHVELVDPADLPRFAKLDATPVLSFQWGAGSPDQLASLEAQLGPERLRYAEAYGRIQQAGARVAFGSDWPVDPFNEWYDLQLAVTRSAPDSPGRLNDDPGLTIGQALRAATINAAYQLHQDDVTGSLEAGKFADLIVLDRNPFKIPSTDISKVRVLMTVVGGKTVYQSESFK